MADLPGIFGPNNRFRAYSNAPSTATDAAGVEWRGLLAFDTSLDPDQLVYVVVRMDTLTVVWVSPLLTVDGVVRGAGSGSLGTCAAGLRVTWNALQGAGAPTKSEIVPGFVPELPAKWRIALGRLAAFMGL